MYKFTRSSRDHHLFIIFAGVLLCCFGGTVFAWSGDGHNAIGMLALDRLSDDTRHKLKDIVGALDEQSVSRACIWPDVIREEEDWEWSKPNHYINIPRGDFSYQQSRDCPDRVCATEAIKRYAGELADQQLDKERRWQAFAWLCHLVADVHQPMHAGFADDRGGNDFEVTVENEAINLHYYWDQVVIKQHLDDWRDLRHLLESTPAPSGSADWTPEDVDDWTNESHALAVDSAYPPTAVIGEPWASHSWEIALERINLAATRLALVISTALN